MKNAGIPDKIYNEIFEDYKEKFYEQCKIYNPDMDNETVRKESQILLKTLIGLCKTENDLNDILDNFDIGKK